MTNDFEKLRDGVYKITGCEDLPYINKTIEIQVKYLHMAKEPRDLKFWLEYQKQDDEFSERRHEKLLGDENLIIMKEGVGFSGPNGYTCNPEASFLKPDKVLYVVMTYKNPSYVTEDLEHAQEYADFLNLKTVRSSSDAMTAFEVYRLSIDSHIRYSYVIYTSSWAGILKRTELKHLWWHNEEYQKMRVFLDVA